MNMLVFCLVIYLVICLLILMLIWATLVAAKRGDKENGYELLMEDQGSFFE
jgi:hypothetical protein